MAVNQLRKAAIILMSLPEEEAGNMMTRLDPKLVEQVAVEIAKTQSITADERESTIQEFAACNPSAVGSESGGLSVVESLVQKALGKDAAGALSNIRQHIEDIPFGFLQAFDSQNILTYVNDEHPQTIALIMSHLPPSFAAEILAGLSSERQLSVVRRIANMGQSNPEVVEEVEQALQNRMSGVLGQSFEVAGGVESVAEVLNVTDRQTERTILENLAEEDPELVDEIRRRMFVFDDIGKLPDKDIQTLLKNVENNQWSLALKGASEEIKQKIFGNMSERASALLREEMEFLGAVKLSSVEQMQQQIVDIVRMLEDSGEIEINSGEEEEQFVQ